MNTITSRSFRKLKQRERGTKPLRVALVQQFFADYRVPVFQKLASHPEMDFTLIHGASPGVAPGEIGLVTVDRPMPFPVVTGSVPGLRLGTKSLLWFSTAIRHLQKHHYDVVIHNFATRWLSLGKARRIQHKRNDKFILWGIGFSQTRTPILNRMRMKMVGSADAAILYSERDRMRYIDMGASAEKLFVARNSTDVVAIDAIIKEWTESKLADFRIRKGLGEGPVILSVGRLAENKELNLLLQAAAVLKEYNPRLRVVIVGDGPARRSLEKLKDRLSLGKVVVFTGSITKERDLAPWFLVSYLVVAPGQIGLLAPHSYTYGRTLVTSDNLLMHGPEVEIVKPGKTAALYSYRNVEKLASLIQSLLADGAKCRSIATAARVQARKELGIHNMANGVLKAISFATGKKLSLFDS